jgi:hypothetical protein
VLPVGLSRARPVSRGLLQRRRVEVDYDHLDVAGHLVKYVRSGAAGVLRDAIADLGAELDTTIDPSAWKRTLATFDEARALLNYLGVEDVPDEKSVVLDLRRWRRLVRRILQDEYDSEVRRLRDARAGGYDPRSGDVLDLCRLLNEAHVRTGTRRRRRSNRSFLAAQVAERRVRGRRDNPD